MNSARSTIVIALVALIGFCPANADAQEKPGKLKIFILAGQSNMEGKGSVETMNRQLNDPDKRARFAHLKDGDQWIERDDVEMLVKFRPALHERRQEKRGSRAARPAGVDEQRANSGGWIGGRPDHYGEVNHPGMRT